MSNMVVNTNVLALNSHRALKNTGADQARSSAKLSSGMRINSAADDAAGLAISEKMRSQIRGLDQASRNGQDGISLIQTAEGGLQEIGNMLQRMRELVTQASNDTNEATDRTKIVGELSQLTVEISAMSDRVEFNGKKLINGTFSKSAVYLQVGANKSQSVKFCISPMNATKLSITKVAAGVTGGGSAISKQLSMVDVAIERVSSQRAKLGAVQNRLEYTIKSLDISSENLSASESRIRDTDMAKEMMKLTQKNVLQQAATSMLAQANQAPQNVMKLLQ